MQQLQLRGVDWALLMQRLEGSRLHERLRNLNRSEQVQKDQAPGQLVGCPTWKARWCSPP
jgi:hypothetical protein